MNSDMNSSENPFRVLGITTSATDEEVRKSYMALVRQCPPERDPENFKRIRAAYEMMKDAKKRTKAALQILKEPPAAFQQEDDDAPGPCGLSPTWWLLVDPWSEVHIDDFPEDLRDPTQNMK